jgi:ligand-binding sensor domain-containing protein
VEWIKKFPDQTSEATEPQIFSDACEAADSLLKDVALSNQIANRPFDGRGYVFLNGVQTCPKGVGRYRADGTAVLLKGWNALVFKDNKRIERVIPKEVPADRAQIIFLDSSDRIWISIKDGELFASTKEGFEKIAIPALQNNPVTSITEDLRGALWFGSTPSFDQKAETYHQKNLHMFKEGAWQHFDSRDGLIQNSTLSMARSDKSGLAIGTRSGISFINLDGKVTNYGEEQGLDPRHIASVNIDGRNQVWFSHLFHGDGIGWISKGIINRFTSKQGLFNPKIGNIALDRYGKVWVEASNGKIGVYPLSYLKDNAISFQIPPKTIREIGLGEPRNN